MSEPSPRALYEKLLEPLRDVARAHGYAIGVHGSFDRDMDLIAVPWTTEAVGAEDLAEAIRAEAERTVGQAALDPLEGTESFMQRGCPGMKPHGRLVWSFHLGGGPYIDLSVMPLRPED